MQTKKHIFESIQRNDVSDYFSRVKVCSLLIVRERKIRRKKALKRSASCI